MYTYYKKKGSPDYMEVRLSSEQVFDGKLLKIHRDRILIDGEKESVREVVKHPGGVCIAAIDDDSRLWFVKQYRYAVEEEVEELPAGKLEWGEDPDAAAMRELKEETGFTADTLVKVGENYPSPGYTTEILHLYIARGLHPGDQHLDEDERITLYSMPLTEAVEGVMSGRFKDSKTQTLIMILNEMENRK